MVKVKANGKDPSGQSSLRWFLGMILASCFSMVYFIAPFYMLTAILSLLFCFPSLPLALLYASPMLLSAAIKPIPSPWIIRNLAPMLDYFDYEEIHETTPTDVSKEIFENDKNYLCVFQPHGALSYVGIVSLVNASHPEAVGTLLRKGDCPSGVVLVSELTFFGCSRETQDGGGRCCFIHADSETCARHLWPRFRIKRFHEEGTEKAWGRWDPCAVRWWNCRALFELREG
jgi:hypothetical protein